MSYKISTYNQDESQKGQLIPLLTGWFWVELTGQSAIGGSGSGVGQVLG